tara:strand:- start:334 stop:921 length:588 start_codon:yes stop_codon:yes gene_type:complete
MNSIILVGDIGSGKTFVSRLFKVPCFSADTEVIKLYKSNKKCFKALKNKFPKFIKSFPVKKTELFKVISKNLKNLKKIGLIVHPFVRRKLIIFLKKNKKKKLVVLDIPLYLENRMNKKNDIIIFLKTKKRDVNKMLKKRKNLNLKLLNILRKSQFPLEKKKIKASYVLINNYNSEIMKSKVKNLKSRILNDRSGS